ncbi:MAG: P27 family phage terminase small subunit [Oscillospiraceae bacterium]
MAKEQQYIQQLTDLGVYDPAFDGAIHVLCIQERELSRAMKEWKTTAPDPKTAPSITDPLYAEISKLRRDILARQDSLGLTPKGLQRLRRQAALRGGRCACIVRKSDAVPAAGRHPGNHNGGTP